MASSMLVCVLILAWGGQSCYGLGTFGFDIHHRFSDPVKGILTVDGLPEKGSLHYYATMVHRDRIIHAPRLARTTDLSPTTPLTFLHGNVTQRISSLGYLHYANVSVGTPSLSFLVALDTGSDLFWLPCDCTSNCVRVSKETARALRIKLNIYSPNASSTSTKVPCNSSVCGRRRQCSSTRSSCPYQILYLSNDTSSTGILVEDVLHLTKDADRAKAVDARITFGCGQVQTGSFLDGAAPNGLFGLGIENISVPSILAKEGLASNSFSMCFGPNGIGRISFGDKGSSDQGETPFNLRQPHPSYNISITQISVEEKVANISFSAIFDSGTSFTYLNDPAYTRIAETFNSKAKDKRHSSELGIPFEYCYDISSNQTEIMIPSVNLTMKGGDQFSVIDPIVLISIEGAGSITYVYCLGVVKSGDVNIIGQNFMTGYRIVFDREKMVLGWKASNCYNVEEYSNTLPINPATSPSVHLPINPATSPSVPPDITVTPGASAGSTNGSHIPGAPPPLTNHSPRFTHFTYALMMVFFPLFAIV